MFPQRAMCINKRAVGICKQAVGITKRAQHFRISRPSAVTDREYKSTYYVVATIRRLLKTIGLFCKRALQKRLYSAKETCNFKERTNRSHPICGHLTLLVSLHKKLLQKSSSFAGSFICSRERSSCLPVSICGGYDE